MDTAQVRICFLDVLRDGRATQLNDVMNMLPGRAVKRAFISLPQEPERRDLERADQEKVRELFWSFMIQGILIPGLNVTNPNFPHFTVIEYGRKVLDSDEPVPHDPDQFLDHLREVAPSLDAVAMYYIEEGLECFQRGTYTASVVMLGVAVEQITLNLATAVQGALSGAEATNLLRVLEHDKIAKIYDETKKRLEPRINRLPLELSDGLSTYLDTVFAVIRTHRNEAGHPTGKVIDRLTAFGLFSMFPFFCRRASELMSHIQSNGLPS